MLDKTNHVSPVLACPASHRGRARAWDNCTCLVPIEVWPGQRLVGAVQCSASSLVEASRSSSASTQNRHPHHLCFGQALKHIGWGLLPRPARGSSGDYISRDMRTTKSYTHTHSTTRYVHSRWTVSVQRCEPLHDMCQLLNRPRTSPLMK